MPLLWIHTEQDRFISMAHARDWFGAFQSAGGRGTFQAFPAYRLDSHDWFARDPAGWRAAVQEFLLAHGTARP